MPFAYAECQRTRDYLYLRYACMKQDRIFICPIYIYIYVLPTRVKARQGKVGKKKVVERHVQNKEIEEIGTLCSI